MDELQKKLNILRELSKSPEVDQENFEKSLNAWEKDIEQLILLKEYKEFEISKNITSALVSICISLTRKLIDEDDHIRRTEYKADLVRCKWLLNIYSSNAENQIKQIENIITEEIVKFDLNY